MDILPRNIQCSIEEALSDTPVVSVLGPRQVGKSTLVKSMAPDRAYINLDEEPYAATAHSDPEGFITGLPEFVTLDEVQRVPELIPAIKSSVDRNRKPGRFLLTGSANLLLLPRLSESLAGRMEIIRLHPLSESEKANRPGQFLQRLLENKLVPEVQPRQLADDEELVKRVLAGGFPEAVRRNPQRARSWHRQYLEAILEKDVREVARVQDVDELGRLLKALALQTGSLLNVSNLSRDLGIARATVDHYLAVLRRLYLIRLVPAWHNSQAKRLVKSPKVYIPDSGLAATLMNLEAKDWIPKRKAFGNLLESFVIQQLFAHASWTDPNLEMMHFRDKDGAEVDCVLSDGSGIWAMEVKASQSVGAPDTKAILKLRQQTGSSFKAGIILYTGSSTLPLGDNILAVPLTKLWEL
jgi:predicted AAA+ superfamily ATPase